MKGADERADAAAGSTWHDAGARDYGVKHTLDVEVERGNLVGRQGLAVDVSDASKT